MGFLVLCSIYHNARSSQRRYVEVSLRGPLYRRPQASNLPKNLHIEIVEACNEQMTWIATQEERINHWKAMGFESFEEYFYSIDGAGKIQVMVAAPRQP